MIGHIDDNITVPNGLKAKINATNGSIELLENPVK
jgi:muramoyltetrapeptide carboxypeptidase